MKKIVNPSDSELNQVLQRPVLQSDNLETFTSSVFDAVSFAGDTALKTFTERFEKVALSELKVSKQEIEEAVNLVTDPLKDAIQTAAANIAKFHRAQESPVRIIETTPGVNCWRKAVPIQKVGLYIPGGTAPLFSTVLMLGIPATIAGCTTRILCTPPDKTGKINPAILVAAQLAGIEAIYKIGGAQAIAAMSIGTESVPKVDKLFGPGNQYVTAAKVYAQRKGIAIDMPAGPSEVLVAADASVPAAFVAADLLAQAEHGIDSQVVFLTDDASFAEVVQATLDQQLQQLPRAAIAQKALDTSVCIVEQPGKWVDIINRYAPEHLIVMGKYEEELSAQVVNAGSVFIGQYTAESFGDYASGTNHTLPTAGFARAYSGVSLDSFVKKITYQTVSETGLKKLGNTVIAMAEAERLDAHANAVRVRLQTLENNNGIKDKRSVMQWIRPDFRSIVPYSSARDEYEGNGEVYLDANENPLVTPYNRYPDPLQRKLKAVIAKCKGLNVRNLFLGNGSDEVLDLILRLVGQPYQDTVACLNPSYGMYAVLAKLNGLNIRTLPLDADFKKTPIDIIREAIGCKVLIICNPNNPTGSVLSKDELRYIAAHFSGVLVVDEAYADFCPEVSMVDEVEQYPNVIVVQTLSKAYGMAGLRIGLAIADPLWIGALNNIKPPYNISTLAQEAAIECLETTDWSAVRQTILSERSRVAALLEQVEGVICVFPSAANFLLFRITNAAEVYDFLLNNGVVVRNRSTQFRCENTLRVSIGTPEENNRLMELMSNR